ncbi:MAG: CinA family nicotinamide mononucleotide deamidase-related protein [Chloroflexota bacterium]
MKAEIVSIGTELLLGNIVDTNTAFLANELAALGIDLYYVSSVGDNRERLAGVLKQAWGRSELILTTGGLGPTQGDITREVVAGVLGEKLEISPVLQQNLVNYFTHRHMEMPSNNLKQATLIPSASPLLNPIGTAPGWWVEKDGRILVDMPGPPAEMNLMWRNEVVPRLKEKTGGIILSRVIKTFGLSESKMDEILAPLISCSNPTLATYAKVDGIHLRITAKSDAKAEAEVMIAHCEADIRAAISDAIWGCDNETQGSTVGQLLIARKLSLAVAESFTGGLLTQLLASTNQSRSFFRGGLTTDSVEVKVALGLESQLTEGAASPEMALAMASLVRHKFGADIGVSIEGKSDSADPGATAKIFVAIAGPDTNQQEVQSYTGRLHQMKTRAPCYALFNLIKRLG